jgi:hypothetical protein
MSRPSSTKRLLFAERRDHPVIQGQPQRQPRRGEFFGPGGFPAPGEPDDQDQRGDTRVL